MKCVRFEDLRTGNKRIGFLDGDVIRCVYGSLETYWQITDEIFAMRDVRLLAPCVPKQIICVSFNYQKHAAEFGVEIPREPSIFSKAAHTVVGTGADIIWPKQVQELAFGAELGIVVKKRMKNVKAEDVPKSFDTFCPLGPWLETELDPSDLSIRSYVNGVLKQDARTSNMIYNPYEILSYISQSFTLDAGDLILTGTPVGAGLLNEGDEITIEIEGIGKITNRVVME